MSGYESCNPAIVLDCLPLSQRKCQTLGSESLPLVAENPFHRSLHFKCINREENVWSVRITRSHRAVGVLDGDTVTWFWIGGHDDYERFFRVNQRG